MGLQGDIELKGKINITNAYINLKGYVVKKNTSVLINLNAYKDKEERDAEGQTVETNLPLSHIIQGSDYNTFILEKGTNIESNIYEYLKSLSVFNGFEDVLE